MPISQGLANKPITGERVSMTNEGLRRSNSALPEDRTSFAQPHGVGVPVLMQDLEPHETKTRGKSYERGSLI